MKKKILVMAFEPFGGESTNPSWEAVSPLQGRSLHAYEFVAVQLPCVFGKSLQVLRAAIDTHQPEIVIAIGQAGGRVDISIERVAINVDDARIPDNEGNQPIDSAIEAKGEPAYFSSLPLKAIVQNLRQLGIPASVSNTAGTYVCNHVFYGLMHTVASEATSVQQAGFVHIPYLPAQAARHPHAPSMAQSVVIQAIESMAQTCIDYKVDVRVSEGATH